MQGVDCIKIADNRDIKEKTAGKAEGIEPLCLHMSLFVQCYCQFYKSFNPVYIYSLH